MVDAEKEAAQGISAIHLRTGGFCHPDVSMVEKGLNSMGLDKFDLIIIENVGNLVCSAEFDIGAIKNVMILSVPEGDDRPLKYPFMFTVSDVLVVNKIDYLDLSNFDTRAMRERVLSLNPKKRSSRYQPRPARAYRPGLTDSKKRSDLLSQMICKCWAIVKRSTESKKRRRRCLNYLNQFMWEI